jgi:putative FmdB family regulatory protein
MPIYEYRRPDGTTFEIQQSFSDDALEVDPESGVPVQRVLHAPAVHFKGKGFYNTDYGTRNRQRENAANAESPSAKDSSSGDSTSSGSSSGDSSSGDSSGKTSSGGDGGKSSGDGAGAGGKAKADKPSGGKDSKPVSAKS